MNFLFVALVSVILATGVFNTEPKDSEGNKKTEIIVKESSETKPAEEKVKPEAQAQAEAEAQAAAEAQAQAEAEAQAAAEAQEESKEIDSSKDSGTNYLRLALYIFGSILVISIGAYFAYLPSVLEYIIKTPIQYITENLMIFTGLGVLGIGEEGEFLNSLLAGIDLL